MVGERAVVHQAEIAPGGKGVRVLRCDGALGCHAGVADGVGARHRLQPEAGGDVFRQALLLVDFDGLSDAHDPHIAMMFADPAPRSLVRRRGHQHEMAGAPETVALGIQGLRQPLLETVPIVGRLRMIQSEFAPALRGAVAVDREPGAVRSPVGHFDQHGGQAPAQFGLQRIVLQIEPNDAAHESVLSCQSVDQFL